jgi:hypothetical protein
MAREDGFFDDLARGLASGTLSRGKALRLMGAALVGSALGSVGIGEAAAAPIGCKADGKKCKKGNQCCSGNCEGGTCAVACVSDGGACTGNTDCCSDNCDSSGFCFPPTGQTRVLCQCADASGGGNNIPLACLSECPELFTFFIPVCSSVCANSGLEFVSGACTPASPLCA